jgi:hypothetical protein
MCRTTGAQRQTCGDAARPAQRTPAHAPLVGLLSLIPSGKAISRMRRELSRRTFRTCTSSDTPSSYCKTCNPPCSICGLVNTVLTQAQILGHGEFLRGADCPDSRSAHVMSCSAGWIKSSSASNNTHDNNTSRNGPRRRACLQSPRHRLALEQHVRKGFHTQMPSAWLWH